MPSDSITQMRDFISVAENIGRTDEDQAEMHLVESVAEIVRTNDIVFENLRDVVFKLRAFTESESDQQALGIEIGMQRAADMIENILRRHIDGV